MELLTVLEQKIAALVARINDLTAQLDMSRSEHGALMERFDQEKKQLCEQIEKLEDSLLTRHQNIEELSTERELTKMAVDDLIKSIDTIVNREHEQS